MSRRNRWDLLRPLRRLLRPIEVVAVRRTGGSLLGAGFGTEVLVLETTGRRTGRRRSSVVAAWRRDDGTIVVAGGAGGQARVPDWVANLRADPLAIVEAGRIRTAVLAAEATGADRAGLWPSVVERWPRVEVYEARAGRPVPVFVLTPQHPGG